MKRSRVLVDTNVLVKGALDLYNNKSTTDREIVDLMTEKKVELILTVTLLEEYCKVAKLIMSKDFSGWLRNLIISELDSFFVSEEAVNELREYFSDKIPKEDLVHFISCIIGKADYLISRNREFLRKAANRGFKCVMPEEFLREYKKITL